MADSAHRTVHWSYSLDVGSETDLGITVKKLIIDDAYLCSVLNDKKSGFTHMEVVDLIYH